jgi:hypothetical protein
VHLRIGISQFVVSSLIKHQRPEIETASTGARMDYFPKAYFWAS